MRVAIWTLFWLAELKQLVTLINRNTRVRVLVILRGEFSYHTWCYKVMVLYYHKAAPRTLERLAREDGTLRTWSVTGRRRRRSRSDLSSWGIPWREFQSSDFESPGGSWSHHRWCCHWEASELEFPHSSEVRHRSFPSAALLAGRGSLWTRHCSQTPCSDREKTWQTHKIWCNFPLSSPWKSRKYWSFETKFPLKSILFLGTKSPEAEFLEP